MAEAIQLAWRGRFSAHPNPRVGCVIVKDGVIVGRGWHRQTGTDHAEIVALKQAGAAARDATCYVTLEPCCHQGLTGPCHQALIAAGIKRVVVAMEDPNPRVLGNGLAALAAAGVDVAVGLMREQAQALNKGFVSRMQRRRPYVRCKMAMSLDGRTAMASGESQWITAPAARLDVQRWRGQSGAIVTGCGTVLADAPSLQVRWPELEAAAELSLPAGEHAQPLRVVLDSRLLTSPLAKVYSDAGSSMVITASSAGERLLAFENRGIGVTVLANGSGRVDLGAALDYLAQRQINDVLIEAGPRLAGAFLQQRLVDELILYVAPKLMGSLARPLFELTLDAMSESIALDIRDIVAVGNDWRIIASPGTVTDGEDV